MKDKKDGKVSPAKKENSFLYYLKNLNKKHRLSVREQHTDTEISYIYISSVRIIFAVLGLLLVMFAIVVSIVVYTPVLDRLPGNPGRKSREILMGNILRIDSLQNELAILMQYSENVALVLEGKTPAVRTINGQSDGAAAEERGLVSPTAADSLLRAQMETPDGRYGLVPGAASSTGNGASSRRMDLLPPLRGEVVTIFNPAAGVYGIGIEMLESQQVASIADGTVIMSIWTPEDDYVIQVQHKDDFISIYKRCTQLLKMAGERVEAGEVIGYVNRDGMLEADQESGEFIFELWSDGRPVDPQRYIYF